MKLLQCALLAATIAAAEKLPVLTEPRVVAISHGTTLGSVQDTLRHVNVGSMGQILQFSRSNGAIVTGDAYVSDSISSEFPNLSWHNYFGAHGMYQTGNNLKLTADLQLGWGYANMGRYTGPALDNNSPSLTPHLVICGATRIYDVHYTNKSGRYSIIGDSMVVPYQPRPVCDVDADGSMGVAMWSTGTPGAYAFKADSAVKLLAAPHIDTLHALNLNWIKSSWGGLWLAFDASRGVFYRSTSKGNDVAIDSVYIPGMAMKNGYCNQVTLQDSLLVFGLDSSIVMAKWSPTEFRILSKVVLPGEHLMAAILIDSVVWATTGSKLYSFQLDWQEPATTSFTSRGHELAGLAVTSSGREASFTWNGAGTVALEILSLDGRNAAAFTMSAGKTSRWQAAHPGVYLARSNQGTKAFVVR